MVQPQFSFIPADSEILTSSAKDSIDGSYKNVFIILGTLFFILFSSSVPFLFFINILCASLSTDLNNTVSNTVFADSF